MLALVVAALIAPAVAVAQGAAPAPERTARADGGPNEGGAPVAPDEPAAPTGARWCRPRSERTSAGRPVRSRFNCQIRRGSTWSKRAVQAGRRGGWSIATRPLHGRVQVGRPRIGLFTYTPVKDFVGNDRFRARLRAPRGRVYGLAMAVVVGRPKPRPPKPKPRPSGSKPRCDPARFSTRSDTVLRGRLPCRGRDMKVEIVRSPGQGKVKLTDRRRGDFAYTPAASTERTQRVEFTFRATNPAGSSPNRTATIEVRPASGTCENVDAATTVDTPAQVRLPCKGKGLRYELTSRPEHGTAVVDASTGVARYTPASGYVTPGGGAGDRFRFRAVNDGGTAPDRTATVDVRPSVPRCRNAEDTTTERNTPATIKLDCTGERLRFELVDRPEHGAVELDAGREVAVFTPERDYVTPPDGTPDRFTFRARNRSGDSDTVAARVTIVPPRPTCVDADPVRTPFETATEIELPCQGLELTFEVVDQPEHGRAEVDPDSGRATYTPDDGYFTPRGERGDRFTFRATNRVGSSETGTAEVEVLPAGPTCDDAEPVTTPYRTPVSVTLPCRGTDAEFEIVDGPEHGRLGDIDPESGEVRYTPDDDYFTATGADPDEFTFTASNRGGRAEPKTARVTVEPPAPTCEAAQPVTTAYRTAVDVTLRCDGDAPRYSIVDQPGHGTLGDVDQDTAKVTYTPADDYYTPADGSPDRFTFRATNRGGDSDAAPATVTVLPPEPTCDDAAPVTTAFQTAVKVKLPCDGVDIERIEIVDGPRNGKLADVDLGARTVEYTPDDGYFTKQGEDPDSFTFRAVNRAGRSETRTARVTTQPDKPTCDDAAPVKTPSGVPAEIVLPCRGVDVQRVIVTPPKHGTLGQIDQATGTVTYTADSGYFTPRAGPPDRFTFRATNRGGDSAPAEATVSVEPPAPTCEERTDVDVEFETPRSVKPACKGVEVEYAAASQPGHGTLGTVDKDTGAVTYTPDKGYFSPVSPAEPDTFTMSATNRTGTATTTVRARVLPPPPTCDDTKLEVNYAKPGTVEMTCRSVVKMTGVVVTEGPRNGTLGDGTTSTQGNTLTAKWTYQPNAKFTGDDSFRAVAIGFEGKRGTLGTASIKVNPFKLRAIGDSVTAGFGYYADGSAMSITKLFACKPGDVPNDRCSSNSPLGNDSTDKVKYSDDYGLKNNVSWAAQYANRLGLRAGVGYKNLAVTGSEPENWVPGGYLYQTLEDVVAENPDLTVLTMGANPLLSMFLLSEARFKCGWTFTEAALKSCVETYITQVKMESRLTAMYTRLLDAKDNRIVVSLYPTVAPALGVQPPLLSYSPWQLDYIEKLINDQISAVVKTVQGRPGGNRLFLSTPQRTYFGLWSYYAPNDTCGVPVLHSRTDGYSRQGGLAQTAIVSQVAAYAAPWFSWMLFPPAIAAAAYTYAMTQFCPSTTYWTIEGDTGIHPSRAGYTVFADALQKVANDNKLVPPLP